jgi:hypothetical protein
MPTVTAQPRRQNNDVLVTEFTDTAGTSSTTYTFPSDQNFLRVENKGVTTLTVSVGLYTNVSITPEASWESSVDYSSFSIQSASGTQQFNVRAISNAPQLIQLAGSNMELYGKSSDTKPTTGLKIGTTFFEIDTKVVSMWDGAAWVVI